MTDQSTYAITGLPRPEGLVDKTKDIPFVPGLPVRYNIETLATKNHLRKQWTLFVLALAKFKNMPVTEKLSYFQVAGIHAAPYQAWDGAERPRGPKHGADYVPGYCFHNGLNFPTWHRPYMLLFERCVWDNMKKVIDDWVKYGLPEYEVAEWTEEADKWRLPYWDWAAQQTYAEDFACPEVLVQGPVRIFPPETIRDRYPEDGLYPNPFWGFENPMRYTSGEKAGDPRPFGDMPGDASQWNVPETKNFNPDTKTHDILPWDKVSGISRYGLFRKERNDFHTQDEEVKTYTYRGLGGVNNAWQANAVFAAMRKEDKWYNPEGRDSGKPKPGNNRQPFSNPGTLSDAVGRMLSPGYHTTWEQFASTKWYGAPPHTTAHTTGFLSLEYIHNNVHNLTGGANWDLGLGHMGDVAVAALDPVFWLHHCQVDRLFAIWQALNWNHWWDGTELGEEDKNDNAKTKLEPFHLEDHDTTKVWVPELTRNWTKLNYTYDTLNDAIIPQAVRPDGTLIEAEYIKALRRRINALYPTTPITMTSLPESEDDKVVGLLPLPKTGEWFIGDSREARYKDYIINIKYDRYALDGSSYSIEFFLGKSKAESENNYHPRNFIGRVFTFGGGQRETCGNCSNQKAEGTMSRGQIPLTVHILQHVADKTRELKSYREDHVRDYLTEHLHWRFVLLGGEEVSARHFRDTEVTVLKGEALYELDKEEGDSRGYKSRVNPSGLMPWSALDGEDNEILQPITSFPGDYEPIDQVTAKKPYGFIRIGDGAHFVQPDE